MKIPIESFQKKLRYSVYVYGALDVRLFPNKRLNVDLKNIEFWVSHGLKGFSSIAKPHYRLTEKKTKFDWADDCQKSFLNLKQALQLRPF